jgi:glycosyltransferase involved in cell wall biosynthesis
MTPKIAHVITTFFATNTSSWVSALAQDHLARGWQVDLIVGKNAAPDLIEEKRRQGFRVTQLNSLRKYIHPGHDVRALWSLVGLFKERKYDLVHTHLAKAGVLGRLAAKAAGIPNIVHSVYGATFSPTQPPGKYLLFKNLERLAGLCTDRFVFVGQDLRTAYQKANVCPNGKGAVVYYGKDLAPFLQGVLCSEQERRARREKAGFEPEDIILGNVSRIVPWKGHHIAVQAVRALREEFPRLRLVVVGDAKTPEEHAYKRKLLQSVQSMGLERQVLFTGWQQNPARYYSIFDLYFLTSMPFEGVPGSVIEAVIAGLPIVGFDCYGLREIPGITAHLAAPGDLAQLTAILGAQLNRLAQVPHRQRTSPVHLSQMQERFSMSRMVEQTFAVYRPLLEC